MPQSFPGKLTLHDGAVVGALLTIGEDVLTISAEGITVGTWPLKYCRVARETDSAFQISVDGEPTSFRPAEPIAFAQVAAQRFRASTLADRIDVIRAMPPAVDFSADTPRRRRGLPLDLPRLPIVIGVVVLAVAGLVTVAGLAASSDRPETEGTRAAVGSPPSSAAGIAEMSIRDFTVRWNIRAVQLGHTGLEIEGARADPFEHAFGDFVRLRIDGDANVLSDVVVTVDVAGNANQRELGFHAVEVALAVAEPTSSRDQRRRLLADLGLDPSMRPDPGVLDVTREGVEYVVSHVEGLGEVVFEMGPV